MNTNLKNYAVVSYLQVSAPAATSSTVSGATAIGSSKLSEPLSESVTCMRYCIYKHVSPLTAGMDDLSTLANDLHPVFSDWYELGIALGFHPSQLKQFEATNKKLSRCMIDMLEAWLKKGSNVTRSHLIQALRAPLVDHSDVADELEKKYNV